MLCWLYPHSGSYGLSDNSPQLVKQPQTAGNQVIANCLYSLYSLYYESQLAGSLLSANKVSIRGSGGRACPSGPKSRYYLGGRVCFGSVFPGHVPCGKRVTVGYRFPLGPHFGEPFGVLGRGADVCEKGEGVLAQIGKVRVKAPFATAVDVGGGRTKVARLEGLCRAL